MIFIAFACLLIGAFDFGQFLFVHQALVEPHIMHGNEDGSKHLAGKKEVPDRPPGEVLAGNLCRSEGYEDRLSTDSVITGPVWPSLIPALTCADTYLHQLHDLARAGPV